MKVVILCGGKGYRLKEETEFLPKPMIKIGDYPILWHIMKIYSHFDYRDFIIALGYKGHLIKDYFLNHKYYSHDFTLDTKAGLTKVHWKTQRERDDFKITFVDTGLDTLTAERVLRLKAYLKKDRRFLLTYGDGVGDVNIKAVVKFHQYMHRHHKVVGTLTGVRPITRWGMIKTDKHQVVNHFQEKPQLNQYANGGFMVLETSLLKLFKAGEQVETALERITQTRKIALYLHKGFWYAMDTYRELEVLNQMWQDKPAWKVWG